MVIYKSKIFLVLGFVFLVVPIVCQERNRTGENSESAKDVVDCLKVDPGITCPDPRIKFTLYNRWIGKSGLDISILKNGNTSHNFGRLININGPLKVIIHGLVIEYMTPELFLIKDDYLKRSSDCSVIFVNFERYSTFNCYSEAVANIHHVGSCIGQMLAALTFRIGIKDIHLIAYSLGGHVASYIAKSLVPYKLARITALDPAPMFMPLPSIDEKLDPSDAEFVDAYYTSALSMGENRGHVGFYFNGGVIQPGCAFGSCSHSRAVEYFKESILSPEGFYGVPCESYFAYVFGNCGEEEVIAGDGCSQTTRGLYFVKTNNEAPFAKGQKMKKNKGASRLQRRRRL